MADGNNPKQVLGQNNAPNSLLSYSAALQGHNQTHPAALPSKPKLKIQQAANFQIEDRKEPPCKPIAHFQGKKAVLFSIEDKSVLIEKHKYVLIGKFSHARPSWLKIKEFFAELKLIGFYNIAMFDKKHLYIECSNNIDFNRIWLRLRWFVDGCAMRILKWVPDFSPAIESPIVPVWIRLEGIPLYLYEELPLWQIATAVGKPIKVDSRNLNRTMLNTARVCVELDISKPAIESFLVCFEDKTSGAMTEHFNVAVYYDSLPHYCSVCYHVGHKVEHCKRRQPTCLQDDAIQERGQQANITKTWTVVKGTYMDKGKGIQGGSQAVSTDGACSSGVEAANTQAADDREQATHQEQAAAPHAKATEQLAEVETEQASVPDQQVAEVETEQAAVPDQQVVETEQAAVSLDVAELPDKQVAAMQEVETEQAAVSLDVAELPAFAEIATTSQGTRQAGQAVHVLAGAMDSHLAAPGQQMQDAPDSPAIAATEDDAAKQAGQISDEDREQQSSKTHTTDQVAETLGTIRERRHVIGKVLSWADQVELEQEHVSANSRSKDHHMALEHTFELHSEKEQGAFGNLLCIPIPEFYDLTPQEQIDDTAIIMAEFYWYSVSNAHEEEIVKDSKDNRAAPDSEHLPTEQEWQTVTGKKKRTTKVKADQKGYQSRQMVDTRIESLCARINKMKRDCPAKRKLLAELEDLKQLHFEDGVQHMTSST